MTSPEGPRNQKASLDMGKRFLRQTTAAAALALSAVNPAVVEDAKAGLADRFVELVTTPKLTLSPEDKKTEWIKGKETMNDETSINIQIDFLVELRGDMANLEKIRTGKSTELRKQIDAWFVRTNTLSAETKTNYQGPVRDRLMGWFDHRFKKKNRDMAVESLQSAVDEELGSLKGRLPSGLKSKPSEKAPK